MAATIVVETGRFSYGERDIFRKLSLTLDEGEALCLLGPNGCGKTTLLRCISGSLEMQEGRVLLDGQETSRLGATRLAQKVGFVHQEHVMVFPFSVLEVVRMGRAPYLGVFSAPSARDTAIAEEALEAVGIWELRDKPYTQVSGGERQLALVARALAQQSSVLLLDEPTSHLDFGNQVRTLRIVRRLVTERGLSVIMATHFPNHALMIADKVALMKNGELALVGDPETTMTEANLYALYGVEVKVVRVDDGSSGGLRVVVPLMDAGVDNAITPTSRAR